MTWLDGVTYAAGAPGRFALTDGNGSPGAANSGNGGGGAGGSRQSSIWVGGTGGPGVVQFRIPSADGTKTTTGTVTMTPSGSYIFYKFTGPGTIQF